MLGLSGPVLSLGAGVSAGAAPSPSAPKICSWLGRSSGAVSGSRTGPGCSGGAMS